MFLAVIGAFFGDEGKGHIVDYLASLHPLGGLVVRFSGGPQAGHTVVLPDGTRHVFRHFGSATLQGWPTYFSKHTIVNPILFRKEYTELENKGYKPKFYVDRECLVTTPYDMLINQIVETARGSQRHGSCGFGLYETIIRGTGEYGSRVKDIHKRQVRLVQQEYVHQRLDSYSSVVKSFLRKESLLRDALTSNGILEQYFEDLEFFFANVTVINQEFLSTYANIIFEGSQGLLLDKDRTEYFPYLTPFHTGLTNAMELVKPYVSSSEPLDVYYTMRPYITRHGAGPLPNEHHCPPYSKIIDHTNLENLWQGALRYGWLNTSLLAQAIRTDLTGKQDVRANLAINCLDQIDDTINFFDGGLEYNTSISACIDRITNNQGLWFDKVLAGFGPTRLDVAQL